MSDPSVTIPIQIVIGLASGAFTLGAAYAMVQSKLSGLRRSLDDAYESLRGHRLALERQLAEIGERKVVDVQLEGHIKVLRSDVEHLQRDMGATLTREVFEAATDSQNRLIERLLSRSTPQPQRAAAPLPREDEPYDPGPMRPRLPTKR